MPGMDLEHWTDLDLAYLLIFDTHPGLPLSTVTQPGLRTMSSAERSPQENRLVLFPPGGRGGFRHSRGVTRSAGSHSSTDLAFTFPPPFAHTT
jgi:hypothetical protein